MVISFFWNYTGLWVWIPLYSSWGLKRTVTADDYFPYTVYFVTLAKMLTSPLVTFFITHTDNNRSPLPRRAQIASKEMTYVRDPWTTCIFLLGKCKLILSAVQGSNLGPLCSSTCPAPNPVSVFIFEDSIVKLLNCPNWAWICRPSVSALIILIQKLQEANRLFI